MEIFVQSEQNAEERQHHFDELRPEGEFEVVADELRGFEDLVEVLFDVRDARVLIEHRAAFVMMGQAAEVEVDRADERGVVIGDEHLCVDEARGVFVDLDPCRTQFLIGTTGEAEDRLLVGDMRSDDTHVHASHGRVAESHGEMMVDDEVRGGDVEIFLRPTEEVTEVLLTDLLVI